MDPNEMPNILAIIDRLIAPIVQRLDQMDERQRQDTQRLHTKLDDVAGVAHRVTQQDAITAGHARRLDSVEADQVTHKEQLDKMAGRNEVIVWVLGIIGGPIVAALTLAGIAKLFNIEIGM